MGLTMIELESQNSDDMQRPVDMVLYRQRTEGSDVETETISFVSAERAIAGLQDIMTAAEEGRLTHTMAEAVR